MLGFRAAFKQKFESVRLTNSVYIYTHWLETMMFHYNFLQNVSLLTKHFWMYNSSFKLVSK